MRYNTNAQSKQQKALVIDDYLLSLTFPLLLRPVTRSPQTVEAAEMSVTFSPLGIRHRLRCSLVQSSKFEGATI